MNKAKTCDQKRRNERAINERMNEQKGTNERIKRTNERTRDERTSESIYKRTDEQTLSSVKLNEFRN